MFDATLLEPGGTYIIAVTASIGRPNAAQGDWQTLALPLENANTLSHYFTVQAL